MPQSSFTPSNSIEVALVETKQGVMPIVEFLKSLLDSDVYVPSSSEVDADSSGLRPLLFDKDEGTMMSAFTSADRAAETANHLPYCLKMKCGQLFERIPKDFGVVLNPGWEVGMEIPAQGVQDIRRDFLSK